MFMTELNSYNLIACKSCGHAIGKSAPTCPKCGAVNNWVDPRVETIVKMLEDDCNIGKRFSYKYDKFLVGGETEIETIEPKGMTCFKKSIKYFAISVVSVFVLAILFTVASHIIEFQGDAPIIIAGLVPTLILWAAFWKFAQFLYYTFFTDSRYVNAQSYFRLEFGDNGLKWESNDDKLWSVIKEKAEQLAR